MARKVRVPQSESMDVVVPLAVLEDAVEAVEEPPVPVEQPEPEHQPGVTVEVMADGTRVLHTSAGTSVESPSGFTGL